MDASAGATLAKESELVLSVVLRSLREDGLDSPRRLVILRKVPVDRLRATSSVAKSRFCTVFRKSGALNNIQ